ncbi:unnamed protein product, partial [Oikopleura dioica]
RSTHSPLVPKKTVTTLLSTFFNYSIGKTSWLDIISKREWLVKLKHSNVMLVRNRVVLRMDVVRASIADLDVVVHFIWNVVHAIRLTIVYKANVDLLFYVIGSSNENELLLDSVLNCLYDSISMLLRKNVEKRQMLKQLDGVFLAVDEICDGGIVMEIEPQAVIDKVAVGREDLPLTEQTVAQVFQSAKEQIKWSLLK